jgi:type IV fimbrial biogenesis protein FimT
MNARISARTIIQSRHSAMSGFTIIELVTVLIIVGILSVLAVGGFQTFIKDQRVRSYSFDFYAGVLLARNEAIKRNCDVKISPATGGWKNGWTIATATPSCASAVTLKNETQTGIVIASAATDVTYNRNGRLPEGTAAPSFQISDTASSLTYARCLTVDTSGIPRTQKGACP